MDVEYNDNYPTCRATYATFRIYHEDLDPDAVSRALGLQPSEAWRTGEVTNPRSKRPVQGSPGGWLLRTDGSVTSCDVRRHLDWLLDRLMPVAEGLADLRSAGCTIDLFCYWLSASGHGGPMLDPHQMARAASLGLRIGFDIYLFQE